MTKAKPKSLGAAVVTDAPPAAKRAHELQRRLQALKAQGELVFLEAGAVLKEIRDRNYWHALGHESFDDFLASPEIGYKRSSAYKWIRTHEIFVLRYKIALARLAAIGAEKLDAIARICGKDGVDVEDWLHKAEATALGDLREEVRRTTGGAASVEEDEREADLALERRLQGMLEGVVVMEVAFHRFEGLRLRTAGGTAVRVWAPHGIKVEVAPGAQKRDDAETTE